MWFIDIDGCVIKFDIQKYVGKISLFSNDAIRDIEYIIKCVEYRLHCAKMQNASKEEIDFIENQVLRFVKDCLYEKLKECRDCLLEYDNYENDESKDEYIRRYKENAVSFSNFDIPNIMERLKVYLRDAWIMIEAECQLARVERRMPNLPFAIVNDNNDIICESIDGINVDSVMYERPVERSRSAFNRIIMEENNYVNMHDDFLRVCAMIGKRRIVNYDEIYCRDNLTLGVVETLKYIQDLGYYLTPLSHHTGEREIKAKVNIFESELPFVQIFKGSFLKFHSDPARMNFRRGRSSKATRAIEIREQLAGVCSLEGCYLIDDSVENLIQWAEMGGNAILFRPRTQEEIASGVDKVVDSRLVRMYNWSPEEIDRVIKEFEYRGKKGIQYVKKDND